MKKLLLVLATLVAIFYMAITDPANIPGPPSPEDPRLTAP